MLVGQEVALVLHLGTLDLALVLRLMLGIARRCRVGWSFEVQRCRGEQGERSTSRGQEGVQWLHLEVLGLW